MNASLPASRNAATIDQLTLPHTRREVESVENLPLDEARWDAWVAKGVVADAAFAEKMRALAMLGLAVVGVLGAVWVSFR